VKLYIVLIKAYTVFFRKSNWNWKKQVVGWLWKEPVIMPSPCRGGIKRWSASVVCLSVRLSVWCRTSALTRKPKGLGRRNFAQGYPRSHATPTSTSRSKGQKSRSRGGGILWRPPSRTACCYRPWPSLQNEAVSEKISKKNITSAVLWKLEIGISFIK